MIEQREFTVKLTVVKIKKNILRQLPQREATYAQVRVGKVELVCWIKGEALGADGGLQPYVLCRDTDSDDVFLWRQWSPGYDGNTMLVANKRVPFAVVP